MENLIEKANRSLQSTANNEHVTILNDARVKVVTEDEKELFARLASELKKENVVDPLEQFYIFPDKYEVYWEFNLGKTNKIGGELNWENPLTAYFYEELKSPSTLEAIRKTPVGQAGTLHILDSFPNTGGGELTLLKVEDKLTSCKILFHSEDDTNELQLDIWQYYHMACLTRGFLGWQYLFAKVEDKSLRKGLFKQFFVPMCKYLPKLFPEDDFSPLIEKSQTFL